MISYPVSQKRRYGMTELGRSVPRTKLDRRYIMVSRPHDAWSPHHQAGRSAAFADHEATSRPSPVAKYLNEEFEKMAARLSDGSLPSNADFTDAVLIRLHRALTQICDADTVFPHVAPDGEGGVVATWFAGGLMIEVACDSQLRLEFVRQDGDDGRRLTINSNSTQSLRDVRSELRNLTNLVITRNPSWRELFAR